MREPEKKELLHITSYGAAQLKLFCMKIFLHIIKTKKDSSPSNDASAAKSEICIISPNLAKSDRAREMSQSTQDSARSQRYSNAFLDIRLMIHSFKNLSSL